MKFAGEKVKMSCKVAKNTKNADISWKKHKKGKINKRLAEKIRIQAKKEKKLKSVK